jgi:SAM-dependent methyltransferase
MREFHRPEAFDLVVSLNTSFGYFEDKDEDRQAVDNVFGSLRSGGGFVMELMGKEVLARIFQPREWGEAAGRLYLQERKIAPGWDWIENRWIVMEGGHVEEALVTHRLYSGTELKRLLTDGGFASVEVFGSLAAEPYDNTAKRLVVVARKG